ncbi:MAG: hypothetical protein R3D55_14735 [Chloroflexota bacterium]
MVDEVASGQILTANIPWVPSLNVNLSFVVDGWGLFLALVVTGMGALVIVYASSYLRAIRQSAVFTPSSSYLWPRCWYWCWRTTSSSCLLPGS